MGKGGSSGGGHSGGGHSGSSHGGSTAGGSKGSHASGSKGTHDRGKGTSIGADKSDVFGNAEKSAKAPGNNPGFDRSLAGKATKAAKDVAKAAGEKAAKDALSKANSAVGRARFNGREGGGHH